MITDERIASYIDSFNTDYDPIIMTIRREAEENGVPIIRKEAGEFIKLLMLMNKPENILEISRCDSPRSTQAHSLAPHLPYHGCDASPRHSPDMDNCHRA